MTFAKSAALTAGFVAAFGLGVWTGPRLADRAPEIEADVAPAPVDMPAPVAVVAPVTPRASRLAGTGGATAFTPMTTAIAVSTPELHQRLKPLLNRGANMDVAAEGFSSAEQFATVVHASQNTDVPFMLLKHRVLNEGDTLVAAIRKSKPDVDAIVEVDRARAEARSDIAALD